MVPFYSSSLPENMSSADFSHSKLLNLSTCHTFSSFSVNVRAILSCRFPLLLSLCASMSVYIHVPHTCRVLRSILGALLNQSQSYLLRQHLKSIPGAHWFSWAGSLSNELVSASLVLGLQAYTTMPGFLHGCQGLNWGPQASAAGTWLTEPSWFLWVSSFLTNDNCWTVLVLPSFFCSISHMNFHAHSKSIFIVSLDVAFTNVNSLKIKNSFWLS